MPVELTDTTVVALLDQVPPEGEPLSGVVEPRQAMLLPEMEATGFTVTDLLA